MKKLLLSFASMMLLLATYNYMEAQTYVGSDRCAVCHNFPDNPIFDDWEASGHPYKFSVIENNQPPDYPDEAINFQETWMDSLGDGNHTWADIAGVIGGYGWKARFVGTDGHLIGTPGSSFPDAGGGHNQINFFGGENLGWADYHTTKETIYKYSCFKCHTTGGDTTGTWLPGVAGLGTFTEGGVGCESCHGPGSAHVALPIAANIDRVYEFAHLDNELKGLSIDDAVQMPDPNGDDVNFLCGTCHNRDYTDPINSSGGFIKHHEQWDEFVATQHYRVGDQSCVTCHDPHKRVIWGGEGIKVSCESCHKEAAGASTLKVDVTNHSAMATCIDCHMPFAAKSGTTRGQSGYKGDVRSHLVAIATNTESMFTEDGSAVRDDDIRPASLSPAHACLACHNDDPNDNIPDQTLEYAAFAAKGMHVARTYATSTRCQNCHPDKYADWAASGHPYKFNVINNSQPPEYPMEAINFQDTWMDSLGNGSHTWDDIAGVIGGYGWKSRFVGTDGHIIGTAGSSFADAGEGHNQINFFGGENHGWVDYDKSKTKIYNYGCFKCHTTGGDTEGTWLPGVEGLGTFTEGGIGCEACHGPANDHFIAPSKDNVDMVYEQAHLNNALGGLMIDDVIHLPDPNRDDVNFMCGTCHNRDYTDPINSSKGFIKHHEQWDEFVATSHYREDNQSCITCHDPHKRVIWGGDGITKTCESCHTDQTGPSKHSPGLACIDCHMPFAAKSGTTRGQSGFKGDVRSHLVKIIPDTETMFTEDSTAVRDDDVRPAALSLHFACLACHNDDPNDDIPDKTLEQAVLSAVDMHLMTSVTEVLPPAINITVYPNPAVESVTIRYALTKAENISLGVYDISGRLVYSRGTEYLPAGEHNVRWEGITNSGATLTAGVYYIKVRSAEASVTKKLMLLRL